MRKLKTNLHYLLTGLALVCALPAIKAVGLRASIDWARLVPFYWVGLGLRSIFAAVLLASIGLPVDITFRPVWRIFARQRAWWLLFVPFAVFVLWEFRLYLGLILIALSLTAIELLHRCRENLNTSRTFFARLTLPATYFFVGLILISSYNDVAVAAGRTSQYDWLFMRMDSYFLPFGSVSAVVRRILPHFSPGTFSILEAIYYHMFDQVGAAMIIVSLCYGVKHGLRLVGTLLTAYFVTLAVFFAWPSLGPFYTCADHFSHFPSWSTTYGLQRDLLAKANLVAGLHRNLSRIGRDYFIAFPSMHIADPIIVLFFLRHWKRMAYCLVAYDIIMVPAILLLEWHYVVDLIGGVAVAAIAIWLNNPQERPQSDLGASSAALGRDPQLVSASTS